MGVVVDGTPFLLASLIVFREIWAYRHKFHVQLGPIVHTCTSLRTVSQNCNSQTVNESLLNAICLENNLPICIIFCKVEKKKKKSKIRASGHGSPTDAHRSTCSHTNASSKPNRIFFNQTPWIPQHKIHIAQHSII